MSARKEQTDKTATCMTLFGSSENGIGDIGVALLFFLQIDVSQRGYSISQLTMVCVWRNRDSTLLFRVREEKGLGKTALSNVNRETKRI